MLNIVLLLQPILNTEGLKENWHACEWKTKTYTHEIYSDAHGGSSGWDGSAFSISKVWKSIRIPGPARPAFSFIWVSRLPPKVSLFMWRTLHDGLPLHDNLQRIGIPLASRCLCCGPGAVESIHHLFFHGCVARSVWNYFRNLLSLRGDFSTPASVFSTWWSVGLGKSLRSIVHRLIPSLICWHIWCSRNKAFFDDSPMDPVSIVRRVRKDIFLAFRARPFRGVVSARSASIQAILSISLVSTDPRSGIGWVFSGFLVIVACLLFVA